MDMIADPVFVHHHDLAVNEDERAFRRDRTPKLMQKQPEPRVQSGHHRGEAQLAVIVRAVAPSADVHSGKLVFKFDHIFISLLKFSKYADDSNRRNAEKKADGLACIHFFFCKQNATNCGSKHHASVEKREKEDGIQDPRQINV